MLEQQIARISHRRSRARAASCQRPAVPSLAVSGRTGRFWLIALVRPAHEQRRAACQRQRRDVSDSHSRGLPLPGSAATATGRIGRSCAARQVVQMWLQGRADDRVRALVDATSATAAPRTVHPGSLPDEAGEPASYHNGMAMTLRLPPEIENQLKQVAETEHRSVQQTVLVAIEAYLSRQETAEILADPGALRGLAEAREAEQAGDVVYGTEAARALLTERKR